MKTPGENKKSDKPTSPRQPRLSPQEWWKKYEPVMEVGCIYNIEIHGDGFHDCNCPTVTFTAAFTGWSPTYEEWQAQSEKRVSQYYPDATFDNGVTLSSLYRVTIVTS